MNKKIQRGLSARLLVGLRRALMGFLVNVLGVLGCVTKLGAIDQLGLGH